MLAEHHVLFNLLFLDPYFDVLRCRNRNIRAAGKGIRGGKKGKPRLHSNDKKAVGFQEQSSVGNSFFC